MKRVTLGDVAVINPHGAKIRDDEVISFVGMAELDAMNATARGLESRLFATVSKGYTVFRDGDVLAAKITPCWENGKVGQARLQHRIGVGSTEFHVVRAGQYLDDRYLLHFLRQPSVRARGELLMTGSAGQRRVPASFLAQLEIPLPPLPEQRRIAAVLDQVDALRTKRRQVLDHLDSLTQSVFYEMFGDPLTNSRGLARASIGSLAPVLTGNSPSRAEARNFGDEIEWIKSGNLGGAVATRSEEWLSERGRATARVAPPGSILVTCIAGSPASIGKASLVDREVAFNQQINAVLPSSQVDLTFVLGQLKAAPELVRGKSTGGMKGLVTKTAFQSIEILTPPLELQREFAGGVNAIALQRARVSRSLGADDDLFASLRDRAFRGEL